MQTTMNRALLEMTAPKNVRVVPVDPHVKSAKTRELFNAGVSGNSKTAKSTDPTCYDSSRSIKTGLFENVETNVERAVAIKKLGKLLGKKLGYRVNDKAPTRDERAAAQADLPLAVGERNTLKQKRDERYKAILAADAEYQSLHAAHRAAHERVDRLLSITRHYKFTVGTSEGMFFLVKAEGDTWEQIIDKLQAEQQKRAA